MATSPFWNLSYLKGATAMPKCDQRHASQPQGPTALSRVPSEIFLAVFKLLAKDKIRHVRLVCRHWRVLGAYFLMNRVFFSPRWKIMENFTAISRHPIFSKSIKEIVYNATLDDASLLDLDLESYKEAHNRRYWYGDDESYQRGLNQYRKVFRDPQAILDTGEDFAVLKAGMDLLPNAKSFLVLDGVRDHWFRNWYDNTGPGRWDVDPYLSSSLSQDISYCRREAPWDLRILQHIFRAVSLSTTRIENLVLGQLFKDVGAVPPTLTQIKGVDSEHVRNAVRSLNKLSMKIMPSSNSDTVVNGSNGRHLEDVRSLLNCLLEARNLTCLMLDFFPGLDRAGTRKLLERAMWPRLRAMRVGGLSCDESVGLGFMARHRYGVAEANFERSMIYVNRQGATELIEFAQVRCDYLLEYPGRNTFSEDFKSKLLLSHVF